MILDVFLQIVLLPVFLLISLVIFTFPGFFLLKRLNVLPEGTLEKYTIASVVGIAAVTFLAYVLASLHARFLMWLIPILGIVIFLRYKKEVLSFNFSDIKKIKVLFLVILILGIVGQVAVNAPSGFKYSEGIYFWSSHGHDGIWHISLMEEMHKQVFPFQNPEYAGHKLQNYHFFVDLLMSEVTRLFPFSNLDVYFRFMPILFSLLLGLGSFIFVRLWSKSDSAGLWAMFFTYFAGSFGYFLTLVRNKSIGGESIFWVSQTQSVLGNPPHAAAFIVLTAFLFCLFLYLKTKEIGYFLLSVFLGGTVIEFKVYGGALILGGLLVIGLWELLIKRSFRLLILFVLTFFLAFIIYFPNSVHSQEFLVWQPWWFIRTMVVAPDRLDMLDMEWRRQTYLAEHNWKRVAQLEITALMIFLIGNLGMRFIGFWTVFKQLKENIFKNSFNIFFLSITFASFLIPVLFVQKGVAWNAIQFNQYFLLLFGFFAAVGTAGLLGKLKRGYIRIILSVLIIILAIPTQIGLLWQFYSNLPLSKVSYEEIEALKVLNSLSKEEDIILTASFDKFVAQRYYPPVPIHSWYETGYVSAFSGRRTLISDREQVNIMGYDADKLFDSRSKLFPDPAPSVHNNPGSTTTNKFFYDNNIAYVYLVWEQKFVVPVEELNLDLVYQNKDARIYQVKK